ncbi:sigma 54-interacting transcriptional regulator [Desulfitobacterium sp. THU1]|uniref:sigma-54 interaction domain-containing protein n=1 Tax=Desulfitobacterium sp. THU1 TaxID=3138072 RepID=UPI00311F0076
MNTFYNHSILLRNRESFIYEGHVAGEAVRREIIESWQRSKQSNVNPRMSLLPIPMPKEIATQAVTDDWIYQRDLNHENVFSYYNLLSTTKSVIFYTDKNLTIVIQRGNAELLALLNSIHIGIGTNLNENAVGTNAVALANLTLQQSVVIGAEHYIDAFQEFACTSLPNFDEFGDIMSFSLLITKLDALQPLEFEVFKYFAISGQSYTSLKLRELELNMINELLRLSFDQQDKGLILLDERGTILRINECLIQTFHLEEKSLHRKHLAQIFPELVPLFNKSHHTGISIQFEEIQIQNRDGLTKTFFVDILPISKNGQQTGIAIGLTDSRRIHKVVNTLSRSHAYFTFKDLIGSSSAFTAAKSMAEDAAQSASNVLIIGESGTGKELFAQSIHNASSRHRGPFISINCAAIPRELIASDLFGYVEGAFTGARKNGAPGKFELAHKGTLFLDEIGEMPLEMQSVLLKVLEDKIVTRVGGSKPIPIDVKVISATNRNLSESIKTKEFRLDLYYRLNVIKIDIPPLRDRQEDIPLLIQHFISQFNSILHKNISNLTPEAMDLLMYYSWPGNVRELRNIIERSMNICRSSQLTINHLPKEVVDIGFSTFTQQPNAAGLKHKIVHELAEKINEKNQIMNLMKKYSGNKSRVAEELGISRTTLYRKLETINPSPKS